MICNEWATESNEKKIYDSHQNHKVGIVVRFDEDFEIPLLEILIG